MGDAVHNFVDGILIAGSFIVDPLLGLTTTLAIIIHEIPQEIGDVGALLHADYTPREAVLYNFYCSLSILPIAAGGFIYIAASNLIPILHQRSSFRYLLTQTAAFAVGIACMQSIVMFEQALLNA